MSFWNSISQMVSDAGTSIASINVGDSARKLVGRGEEVGENEAENNDVLDKSRPGIPPRPGCPLVVPEPSNDNANTKGNEANQNSYFPRVFGTTSFLKRVSNDPMSPQTSLDQDSPMTHRTGSLKSNAQKFFETHGMPDRGETGSLDSPNHPSDRFAMGNPISISDSRSPSKSKEESDGRRKGMSVKRGKQDSRKISKPSCFMEMPQRWAEVTETRSG